MASRSSNFRFVVWHESANPNWEELLDERCIKFYAIDHDRDLLEDGTVKKLHSHVVMVFPSLKSIAQVKEIVKECCGAGVNVVLTADSLSGAVQYLTHMNHKDKYQYDSSDVRIHNASFDDYIHDITTPSDIDKYRSEIQQFIEVKNICSYYDLSWYSTNVNTNWSRCVNGQTLYWVKYLISREDKLKNHINTDIDVLRYNYYKENENVN